jgi:hypothetical protein
MPPETDNLQLEDMYRTDQSDRQRVYDSPQAVNLLKHSDAMRKARTLNMMSKGEVNTFLDLYRAAVILLHGSEPKDFLTAHRLAVLSAIQGHRPARWLAASALDRYLMAMGQPQTYGTQFEHNAAENQYQLRLPIEDDRLLSWEKKFLDVPPVAERLQQLNGRIQGQ